MKPLNKKERAKAFNKVILLFVMAFAIAMILGFTTMNVNRLASSQSGKQLADMTAQMNFLQKTFSTNINTATTTLTKIPTATQSGEDPKILHQDVAKILSDTKNTIPKGESWQNTMCGNIIKVYSDLRMAYEKLEEVNKELADTRNSTKSSDTELNRALTQVKDLQAQLDRAKMMSGSQGAGQGVSDAALNKQLQDYKNKYELKTVENNLLRTDLNRCKSDLEKCRNK